MLCATLLRWLVRLRVNRRCDDGLPTELLTELLDDLHPTVALAAARALGRLGQTVARPRLLPALAAAPSSAIVAALTPIADETVIARLGQTARSCGSGGPDR